ncbi:hypothetical protein H6778_01930 [Candidatus Nomurabacteria bacterium]|nr:hypothetical protein [Candidatus Nomurabacteria bacterium]
MAVTATEGQTPERGAHRARSRVTTDQTRRITSSDRSGFGKRSVTRNVRTSLMPGNPNNTRDSYHKTTSEEFNETYAQQGLQPSNVAANTPTAPAPPDQTTRQASVAYSSTPVAAGGGSIKIKRPERASVASKTAARARATAVNIWIWASAGFIWSVFQLPFTIASLVFLGLASFIDLLTGMAEGSAEDGFFIEILKDMVGIGLDIAGAVVDAMYTLFEIDLSILNPSNIFAALWVFLIGYAFILLLLIYLGYLFAGLKPLSGKAAGLKKGMLILAIIGYSIPLLNLFPWFIPWTIAVWRYPK